jgi:hypothetical protein
LLRTALLLLLLLLMLLLLLLNCRRMQNLHTLPSLSQPHDNN